MIYELCGNPPANCGNKAKYLAELKAGGFCVPDGFILPWTFFDDIAVFNGKYQKINNISERINQINYEQLGAQLREIINSFQIPENISKEITDRLKSGIKYAVRSSGALEDTADHSFAGQYETYLNVQGAEDILYAVIKCWCSVFSDRVLAYAVNGGIKVSSLKMAVIIQEMVDADISGVAFTVNVLTGNDKEILIEAAAGSGDELVGGRAVPERYTVNWFESRKISGGTLLKKEQVEEAAKTALEIQEYFGYPCDIEFSFSHGRLYILQARAVTKILYSGILDQWTTADFKDGGVSAGVCTPYMWSLYEYIWETELKQFMLESKILKPAQLRKLGNMFYGRPYWNLSVVKTAMSVVPGYKERDFDKEFGVKITYNGDGQTTKITPQALLSVAKIALAQKKIAGGRKKHAIELKTQLLKKYEEYLAYDILGMNREELEAVWYRLIEKDYLFSEGTYFRQIFINTIHQSLFRDKIVRYTGESGYFRLIGGLDNISHLLPFYDMWNITRKIRSTPEAYRFWQEKTAAEISMEYSMDEDGFYLSEVRKHIEVFGYHSKKELDVTYPCYYEETDSIVTMFWDTVLLEDDCSPDKDQEIQAQAYRAELERARGKMPAGRYQKFLRTVSEMREMLWWREEFRDISTRFYYIIRLYSLQLAKCWHSAGVIAEEEDIWYLKIVDIQNFINHQITEEELKRIILRNRKYYRCFRNFLSENEIGRVFDKEVKAENPGEKLHGIGCGNGSIVGTARVVDHIDEIGRLQKGDILVTMFTDTGWTSKFAVLGGIVTEYGGVLCHAAIVSREYGIPCVVCASGATKQIRDGSRIALNGETGEITIIGEKNHGGIL